MEEQREDKIGSVLAWLQAGARGKASRMQFQMIKPTLKCTQFAKYKKEYEDQINLAEANIDEAVRQCDAVVAKHESLCSEKQELELALQGGASSVQEIINKTERLEAARNEVAKQLDDCNKRIKGEEDLIGGIEQSSIKVTSDANRLRDEITNLENECAKCEEDKSTKDNQIMTLREEIAHQDELISKLQKEKKGAGEGRQRSEEDIQAMEDRCNHLTKVKGKLEQSLDECEDSLEREKKAKGDVEKLKRKVEGDLKLTQEAVSDLERIKADLGAALQRKEKEMASMAAKIEDEGTLGSKYSKQVKELQCRTEELDEELFIERANRAKAEKNRTVLSRDIQDLGGRLEEAGSNTSTQIELNKKREAELMKLKSELEEANIAHEGILAALRQKHNNTMSEMGEQIDSLNKMKAKSEKDKAGMERDLQEARGGLDEAMRDRANVEKNCKMTQGLIVESNTKMDELARALNEADSTKKKLQVEAQDLNRQIEETENALGQLGKNKISLTTQLEDTKRLADAEARDRATLLTKFKNLSTDCENMKMRIEEEAERKNDTLRALSKAQAEIQLWKSKFETEALGRIDELEGNKSKLGARVNESEETIDSLNAKIAATEKTKHRIEVELEDLQMEYERTHAAAIITEKRGKNFDKVMGEWKAKADDLMSELEACRCEGRNYSSEVFRLKAGYDETMEQLDVVKRENKNLADEIKDLLDQLGDGGRSIHDLDKQRRRLEVEKEELQGALEEAEGALEQEENKVLRAQLELGQVRQEIDRRLAEKEEEFENSRKNHARAMDSIQASLESEQRAKAEALRIKKKLEGEINELEIGLDHANKANSEGLKSIKRYQTQLRETIQLFEDEARSKAQIAEQVGISERKACALSGEVEESKALLDGANRSIRQLQNDIADSRSAVNNMQTINARDMTGKRQLESSIHTLQAEVDGMLVSAKNAEEKAKKAMVDAARLADELRAEQDHATNLAGAKNSLQLQAYHRPQPAWYEW